MHKFLSDYAKHNIMRKKVLILSVTSLLFFGLLNGCGQADKSVSTDSRSVSSESSSSESLDSSSESRSTSEDTVSSSEDKNMENSSSALENDNAMETPDSSDKVDSSTQTPTDTPEEKNITGYVLSVDGNKMYLDTDNTGARTYIGEGEDRAVLFDVSDATLDIPDFVSGHLRTAISVDVTYYVKDGKNIATKISSDGIEIEPEFFAENG